jgi:MerR family transcriptional regulator, light-induced transcriptional regulator
MGEEATYPLRVAIRMTGLSAERLRAWELRYGAVAPQRTPGGSRRYRESDLERLRLLRAIVDAGRRIGDVADLDETGLRACLAEADGSPDPDDADAGLWWDLACLDAERVRRALEAKQAALGALAFAQRFAMPFLCEVGRRWEAGRLSIAAEHLASSLLMSMIGESLRSLPPSDSAIPIVFATPAGERHEIGLFIAALTAAHAGADPIYLGADIPEADLVASLQRSRALVLTLGIVSLPTSEAEAAVRRLRQQIPARVEIWMGGSGMPRCRPIPGVERITNLEQLATRVGAKRPARDRQA